MRRLLLAAATLLVVLLPGTPAWAHTALVTSDPARDARLTAAPAAVSLVFSQKLNPDFTTIVLSDAAARRVPASAPAIADARATITLEQPLGNGVYTVAYRVVSLDGHTVQGAYPFTVADPALPAAGRASEAAAAAPDSSAGLPAPVLAGLVAAGILLASLGAYFALSGRRRAARTRAEKG
ncbi:hypothetical protein GCM10010172_76510 [Paractinoplanes ferrugineus]|uniref:CopC domain-containing protein n=1 Tax=Paractinoplanes ferrugineus TaxID=113564 RepID=A0A919JB51_9ACTN|nr:copper resistance CopC family protein [Actinoplanes ferrugineus]GIE16408.1 hypothetical protein Afe05nite_82480 [Actinoplanes ferrugineus]